MKVCIIQPAYSTDFSESDNYFEQELKLIDMCDESMDIIVLPESSDIPCLAKTVEEANLAPKKFTERLLKKQISRQKNLLRGFLRRLPIPQSAAMPYFSSTRARLKKAKGEGIPLTPLTVTVIW